MRYLTIVDQFGRKIPAAAYANAYEGAGYGRRMSGWGMSTAGPNAALFSSLSALRSRQRQLVRNHPLAAGGVDSLISNMVGKGITPRWQIDDSDLKEQIQELWADSVDEMDAAGVSGFYGLQDTVGRTMANGGETLVRFRSRRPWDGLAVPLQLQVLEGDHLDEAYNTLADNGNEIRMGIEFNGIGRRAAYWLFKNHPGEQFLTADNTSRVRVPASEMLHVFRPLRAGQIRGVPWFAQIIVKLHEIDQCVDAELVRRKTTAMFGGFVTRTVDYGGDYPPPIGLRKDDDAQGNAVIEIEPGTFPELPPGMDVKFAEPKDVSGNYTAWMEQQLRDIARGMGITYEQLTGDLEGVNYSSIRAGLLEFRRLITMIQYQTLIFQFCRPVVNRWLDTAVLSGALVIPDYLKNRRKYRRVQWMPDGWDWVDPVKDQKADMMEIRNGLTSRARKVAERGGDIEVIDREIAEDNERSDRLGLVFDSDPRKTTASGIYQEKDDDENK